MQLVDEICRHRSVAVVGLAKNAGKTECLNYILRHADGQGHTLAVTSIGIDGESRDQVTGTHKPEITLAPQMLFVTSETHYRQRRLPAEILDLSDERTSLGRLVTARALDRGKVILSGPADTATLRKVIARLDRAGVGTTIVDGALSRLSLSSPAVTDAMVLATGAALSPDIDRIVRHTAFVCSLTELPVTQSVAASALLEVDRGMRAIDDDGQIYDPQIASACLLDKHRDTIFAHGHRLYVAGAVTDRLMTFLSTRREVDRTTLIVRDFTRIFAEQRNFAAFLRKGGKVEVLQRSRLLAVCINPTSPQGYHVDGTRLRQSLQEKINVPVINVREMDGNARTN